MIARRVPKQAFDVEQVTVRDMLESLGRMAQWFQRFSPPETDDTAAWELVREFPGKISQLAEAMKVNEWDTAFKSGTGASGEGDETVRIPIQAPAPSKGKQRAQPIPAPHPEPLPRSSPPADEMEGLDYTSANEQPEKPTSNQLKRK
jgi:hypothetical protein